MLGSAQRVFDHGVVLVNRNSRLSAFAAGDMLRDLHCGFPLPQSGMLLWGSFFITHDASAAARAATGV